MHSSTASTPVDLQAAASSLDSVRQTQPEQKRVRRSLAAAMLIPQTEFIQTSRLQSTRLTQSLPLPSCRASVIIPVRNEAKNLPAAIAALARQVDSAGNALDPDSYEILVLANNCTDDTAAIAQQLSRRYPQLHLLTIAVSLPKAVAHVGKARQMVMDEAYRRFSLVGLENRIIASTDGDTEVAPDWINALFKEFDKGVDAVGGRIMTRRSQMPNMGAKVSLYYLRRLAHAYFAAQIECLLDPQAHDCWPRHFQYCGANMAVSAEMYGQVGGMPLVKDEEDVALYRRLQRADAKIRHSLDVRVSTSARQVGRATGGLSELLETLSHSSQDCQKVFVESPEITEARILVRKQLRQVWGWLQGDRSFNIKRYATTTDLLARSLGLSSIQLRQCLETSPTFGELVAAISDRQTDAQRVKATTEISVANMYLRQRLQAARQAAFASGPPALEGADALANRQGQCAWASFHIVLKALQQVQTIPLLPLGYQ